jgi:hypothetical protein
VNVVLTQFNLSKTAGFFFRQFHGVTVRPIVFVMPLDVKAPVQGRLPRMNPDRVSNPVRVSPANRRIMLRAIVGLLSALLRFSFWNKVSLLRNEKTFSFSSTFVENAPLNPFEPYSLITEFVCLHRNGAKSAGLQTLRP